VKYKKGRVRGYGLRLEMLGNFQCSCSVILCLPPKFRNVNDWSAGGTLIYEALCEEGVIFNHGKGVAAIFYWLLATHHIPFVFATKLKW